MFAPYDFPQCTLYNTVYSMVPGTVQMEETVTKLMEKMVTMEPILATVTAEEVVSDATLYPAQATSIEIAFVLVDSDLPLPKFVYQK